MSETTEKIKAESINTTDDLLDRVDEMLDIDKEDEKIKDRLRSPFVRHTVSALVGLLFLVFFTYFLSFILDKPLPNVEFLNHFLDIVLESIKEVIGI